MPTITKSRSSQKAQVAAPVTALASRDRSDVPTAKRRAGHRSQRKETSPGAVEKIPAVGEAAVTLPPPGGKPDDAPTRSMTQITPGAEGRMAMRIVALDLGIQKTSYCEILKGQVVHRTTVSELSTLQLLLGPEQPPATVAIEACRQAWFVHDLLLGA